MTLAILLFGLVIATCVIAYIADNIGKNMGKKRISLFGLRPRQTATLISMASSVFIMLATVGILMATSKSLSNALLRYDAARKEANERQRENKKLVQQNSDLRTNLQEQRAQIAKQNAAIKSNRLAAERISLRREQAESNLKRARARLQSARASAMRAQKQLASAKAQVAAARARVARAQTQVQSAQAQLKNEQARVLGTSSKLKATQQELQGRRHDLIAAQNALRDAERQQQLAVRQSQIAQQNLADVQASVVRTMAQLTETQNKRAELEAQRDKLETELETQRTELARIKAEASKYKEIADRISVGDIAIPQGEVFAERTIPANLSAGQMRAELRDLMKAGRDHLSDPPRTLKLDLPEAARNLSEDEFLEGFAAYLSTLRVPVSVRLLAARDHARGETEIDAYLLPIVVRPVFKKDEVLGSARIEAGSDASIFNQLLKLLNATEQRARERGVTPLPTRENPLFYPTGTNERVFEALRQIQSEGGTVAVRVVAAEDISSVDSPHVRFEIAHSPSSTSP